MKPLNVTITCTDQITTIEGAENLSLDEIEELKREVVSALNEMIRANIPIH